ncbi:helix-turn-helix domain-containing protein [Oceanospirillum beijerinckii]|uniref:helix-turn-helix domain-containing protein n=1 Tax=Oceanospirillum beijerinckii TaxID=64976 RepID=UPI00040DB53F|nr:helix-turn-helix domain-containing protein [Oceanospirillum beijerinckii]
MMKTNKLMSIEEWRKRRFLGEAPAPVTVRKWCANGEIPAKKIGGNWYIDVDAEANVTGKPLVDMVLNG